MELFGGWVDEVEAGDLPQGASPYCQDVDFEIGAAFTRAGLTALFTNQLSKSVNYFVTFNPPNFQSTLLLLDSTGQFYAEDTNQHPGILTPIAEVIAGSFCASTTDFGREYLAFSDLEFGLDIPRQYDGSFFDRVSQDGPGAAIAVTGNSTGVDIVAAPNGTTQPAKVTNILAILWSSGPGIKHTPGNLITIYYNLVAGHVPDPNVVVGANVVLTGFGNIQGNDPNAPASYPIVSVQTVVGGPGGTCNTFTVIAPASANGYVNPPSSAGYQITLATVKVQAPVASVAVGGQITLAGVGISTWDGTWTVLGIPITSAMVITSTGISSNTATYGFTLQTNPITGLPYALPVAGQLVTIQGTLNGGGVLNLAQAVLASVSSTQFSVVLNDATDVATASDTGTATVQGTEFNIDPAINPVTAASPILGNSGGGTLLGGGIIAGGARQAVVMFQTRSGFVTQPSPITSFNLSNSTGSITVSNIPTGPANVVNRIIAFTPADGAFFFYIPDPVTVNESGVNVTYSSTVINDNVSTQATFNFTDTILLAGISIDTSGNDLFNLLTLAPCLGNISYADRMLWWGQLNKVQNFRNMGFDGGILPNVTIPLGWTQDKTYGTGGSLDTGAADFGFGYQMTSQGTGASNPLAPAIVANVAGPGTPWTNAPNLASPSLFATVTVPNNTLPKTSNALAASNFGFAVGGTIQGIQVSFEGMSSVFYALANSGFSVQLLKGGVPVGQLKTIRTSGSIQTFTLGSSSDLWGAPWAVGDINASSFGVQIIAGDGQSISIPNTFSANNLKITVFVTGSTWAMIEQSAYQDSFNVAILSPNVTYEVRLLIGVQGSATSGAIVVDLFSPSLGVPIANATIPLSQLVGATTNWFPASAAMSQATPASIPTDLLLRVYIQGVPSGESVVIDELEVADMLNPYLSTQLWASYVIDPEQFDGVSGIIDIKQLNGEAIKACFQLRDNLYIVKEGSLFSTSDNGQDPSTWTINTISNKVGTPSVHGVGVGEEWVVIANQSGLYMFNGNEPIKISQEIQPFWDNINWDFGHTLWVVNDTTNRRILIGVPTGGSPVPDCVLMMNYREMNESWALAQQGPLHISYSGRMISWDMSRKWSPWYIYANYGGIVSRPGGVEATVFGNNLDTNRVYQLDPSATDDDGMPINSVYTTFFFINRDMEQGLQAGSHRHLYTYLSLFVSGQGTLQTLAIADDIYSTRTKQLANRTLKSGPTYDTDIGINFTGDRVAFQLTTNLQGAYFKIAKAVVTMKADPFMPVRGRV